MRLLTARLKSGPIAIGWVAAAVPLSDERLRLPEHERVRSWLTRLRL